MPTNRQIEQALTKIRDQQTFFDGLLAKTLEWPVADTKQIEDIAFGWSKQDLNAAGLDKDLVAGSIWQIQPAEREQPWGIFVLEFKHEDSLSPRRGMAGVLRKVLRGLVSARRKDAHLPSWKREHLLFICTYNWTHFRFAYFRSKLDEPRSAKLTTFGWAPASSNRTVCEFNLPALVWPDDTSDGARWIEDWAKAFDKEPLTRDFFKRFDTAIDAVKAELEKYMGLSSSEAYTQSQLLLERLIFLYFLQNRGWLNRNRHYLVSALNEHTGQPDQFSYYHDFLDRLFWTLATAPGSAARLQGIPFLNGGLFDDDEFHQPANLRKMNPPLKVRNGTMQLVFRELLEAFNFTVTEDTPLNQEVAVDPEMLGKVFESIVLHAEAADPDAVAPDKRKATGSYYTPRIVVHFICREVLYQYLLGHLPADGWAPRLKTLLAFDLGDGLDEEERELLKRTVTPDQSRKILELIKPLKCCDPAVGSGAFPVGLMQELVNLRRLLETVLNGYRDPVVSQGSNWLHEAKAHIVENCLFGVDIQQQAIEICRLRLWLSLVVDYDLGLDPFEAEPRQFAEAIDRMSQLPNLEMNFRRGDSLHDHISGVPVVILPDRASRHTAEFSAIAKLGGDLHKAKKSERKRKLRLDILEKRLELSRKIVEEEVQILRQRDSALDRLFGDEESDTEKRKRNRREIERLEQALTKIEADQKAADKLRQREADPQFYPKLRKLEGADFDSPFNFAWSIDFPNVFAAEEAGFNIIVGNPPFVTARNPEKRELWRQRWAEVCYGTYQLVAPFFGQAFEILNRRGVLGYIVSNAFAKREFGKPLVEKFFPRHDLLKVVDCSGLLFPGHGTPTCLLFADARSPREEDPIRITAIRGGGGDLRTPPEESPLWRTIEANHDKPGHTDSWISVVDRERKDLSTWPWNLDYGAEQTRTQIERGSKQRLIAAVSGVGYSVLTKSDDIFFVEQHVARLAAIEHPLLRVVNVGDDLRNWYWRDTLIAICPYDELFNVVEITEFPGALQYLRPFRQKLESVITFGQTKLEAGRKWFEYFCPYSDRHALRRSVAFPDISTHNHFVVFDSERLFKDTAPMVLMRRVEDAPSLAGLLNSSTTLFWLKQVCFNKGAGEDEHRDRYEFANAKLEQMPIPSGFLSASPNATFDVLKELADACVDCGKAIAQLPVRSLFEKAGEAYNGWRSAVSLAYSPTTEFSDAHGLGSRYSDLKKRRDELRLRSVALQEEMDWFVYGAYGVMAESDAAARVDSNPKPLDPELRPFRLWERTGGEYDNAISAMPNEWPAKRRQQWQSRLAAIRDNEHIRRIEQPVYKRRWDEQWKVGNQWRCGEVAYAAEFIDAFEWWLKERAEWWLEHKKNGGPVELTDWTKALWSDDRVQASWPVAAEQYALLEHDKVRQKAEEEGEPVPAPSKPTMDAIAFARMFRRIVEEETVPSGFPFGTEYEQLAKKLGKPIPAQLKKVRGKLNVPRERFHSVARGQYAWAGLQFRGRASGTAAGDKKR